MVVNAVKIEHGRPMGNPVHGCLLLGKKRTELQIFDCDVWYQAYVFVSSVVIHSKDRPVFTWPLFEWDFFFFLRVAMHHPYFFSLVDSFEPWFLRSLVHGIPWLQHPKCRDHPGIVVDLECEAWINKKNLFFIPWKSTSPPLTIHFLSLGDLRVTVIPWGPKSTTSSR